MKKFLLLVVSSLVLTTGLHASSGDERRGHPRLTFAPCPENPTVECGTLVVPVDYKRPNGETVGIAVIRAKATNPARRIGVLVGNPGGPGFSGVDFILIGVQSPLFQRLRERFDIVSFDPRGVDRSRGVACQVVDPPLPADLDDEPALAAHFDEVGSRFARACLEQYGPFVTKLSTNNVARDLDMIREALGEKQITYAAGSYGSTLGAVYVSLFPERVRGVILDGTFGRDYKDFLVEFSMNYSNGFEMALQHLDLQCRRDANCRLAATGVVAAYDEIAARLRHAPAPVPDGTLLTERRLADIGDELLKVELFGPLFVSALADAQAGNDDRLIALLPAVRPTPSAFHPIQCNDYGTRRQASEYLPVDEALGARNPRFHGRFFLADMVARCSAWPRSDTPIIRNVRGKTVKPVLLIGTHFDSATPLVGTRSLARALGMEKSLVRYEGGGHTSFNNGDACIQEVIESYLFDLRVPPEGFSCAAQAIDFRP